MGPLWRWRPTWRIFSGTNINTKWTKKIGNLYRRHEIQSCKSPQSTVYKDTCLFMTTLHIWRLHWDDFSNNALELTYAPTECAPALNSPLTRVNASQRTRSFVRIPLSPQLGWVSLIDAAQHYDLQDLFPFQSCITAYCLQGTSPRHAQRIKWHLNPTYMDTQLLVWRT